MTRRSMATVGLIGIGVVMVAAMLWQWLFGPGWAQPGNPRDAEQVALGAGLYQAQCAACHGERLQGQADWQQRRPDGRLPAPPHDETGHTWHHPDEILFSITRNGPARYAPPGYETDMPAYAGILSNREIWAILAYIKSRWPEDVLHRQERITEQARGWNRNDGP